jgi:tRNA dimethylallyltransferase
LSAPAPPLICIVGPTASGKTEFSVALAETANGEIVSADSVQVYREFDIGTGKPSAQERSLAPHHLVDVADPRDTWDAARWAEAAVERVRDVERRGKLPIVCGGSFLWVRALVFGLVRAPPADPALRERHGRLAAEHGRAALHARLASVDPASAARLAPNDFVRVSRALEVYELLGVPLSQLQATHGFREPRFEARLYGIAHERSELDQRIERRVERMLQAGWVEEVRSLAARGFSESRAMASVGYRQIYEALPALPDAQELKTRIVRATRVFARRQRTWLRDQPVLWLPARSRKLP